MSAPSMAAVTVADEARRLLAKGFKLCKMLPLKKRPEGNGWNLKPIKTIDDDATGYGVLLAVNSLGSVDPDNVEPAREGLRRCGFDLEEIMEAGVRTSSTRPRSGGRSAFRVPSDLKRIKFSSKCHGTILELRAGQSNLQDCLPGTTYKTEDGGGPYRQDYANGKTLDEAAELPAAFLAWWRRLDEDLEFLRSQQKLFCGDDDQAMLAVSGGEGGEAKLAFSSAYRRAFNESHNVPEILARHGYTTGDGERWAPASATGAACVRLIPGHDDLWQSDHASDPLCGTFDPWSAFVVLDHGGDLEAAEAAREEEDRGDTLDGFDDLNEEKRKALQEARRIIEAADVLDLSEGELVEEVGRRLEAHSYAENIAAQIIAEAKTKAAVSLEGAEKLKAIITVEKPAFEEYDVDFTRLKPVEFAVDGFISNGLTVLAGAPGVGKTSMIVPLAAAVAGLYDSDIEAVLRRRVVYVSESPEQVERILYGLLRHAPGARPGAEFKEWFKVVAARRLPPERLAGLICALVKKHTVVFNGYSVAPLIILDTSNATLDLNNENDNSEVGKAIAAIKENLSSGACWLVAHTPKAMQRADVEDLSARGAGAFAGDANATAFVFEEKNIPDKRFMLLRKHRFEAEFLEMEFSTATHQEVVATPWGTEQTIKYRIGLPAPSHPEKRLAAKESAKTARDEEHLTRRMREIRGLIRDYLDMTDQDRQGKSKNMIEKAVRRQAQDVRTCISHMVEDGDLVVVGGGRGGSVLYALPPEPSLSVSDEEDAQ